MCTVTVVRANAASSSAKPARAIGTLLTDRPAILVIMAAGMSMAIQAGIACTRQSLADSSTGGPARGFHTRFPKAPICPRNWPLFCKY